MVQHHHHSMGESVARLCTSITTKIRPHSSATPTPAVEQKLIACQNVPGTYELLEQIIASLPTEYIYGIRLVNKTWNQLYHESDLIQRARILKPERLAYARPVYPEGTTPFKLNPAFPWTGTRRSGGKHLPWRAVYCDFDLERTGKLPSRKALARACEREEFATSLPVKNLHLGHRGDSPANCCSREEGGARVKHLCEALGWPGRCGEVRRYVYYLIEVEGSNLPSTEAREAS